MWDNGLTDVVRMASFAASDASRWPQMLNLLSQRFGATAAAIHTPRGAPANRPLFIDVGLPKYTVADYVDYWSERDPWFAGAASKQVDLSSGKCIIGRDLCDWDVLDTLDYYNEFAAPTGVKGLLGMIVDDGSNSAVAPLTVLGLYRRPGMEEFSYQEKRDFESIHAPLQVALHSHWSLARSGIADQATAGAFAVIPKPVLVLSRAGAVLFANAQGQAVISKAEWIGTHQGKIDRLGRLGSAEVQGLLYSVELGISRAQTLPLQSQNLKLQRQAMARFVPLPEDNPCRVTWPGAAMLLMIDEPEADLQAEQMAAFGARYLLTKAELHLTLKLVEGLRLSEFAETCQVSIHTVRVHLKNIFRKTGVGRQSDLIRLVGNSRS